MSETQEVIYFSAIKTDTKTPFSDIKELSKSSGVEAKFIDFRLYDVVTIYTNEQNAEPVTLSKDELEIFENRDFYLDPSLKIEQVYSVEFFDIRVSPPPKLPPISVGANSLLTKIVATISPSSEVSYEPGYELFLYEFIAKQLIRAGILVGIRERDIRSELGRITSVLRIKEIIDQSYTFVVATGIEPRPAVDSKMIFHYKNKFENIDKHDRIDHANRGFLLGVVPDEIIIEFIKSKQGSNGRNVRGEFIKVNDPKEEALKEINITENIEREEDDRSIKFRAKKAGFVSEDKGTYDIKEQLEINEINFRQTGSVKTEMDSNVSLVIKEDDIFKDAIGTGVVVEAKEVNVKGNVAANAQIKSDKVKIGGQTHAKAKIEAKTADIAIHIGQVIADEVVIDRLEGGSVVAKKVKIKSVVGGQITADEIKIETLGSNCTINALELIDIKYLRGTNNRFIIDARRIKDKGYDIEGQIEKIKDFEHKILKMPKQIETKKIIIDENKASIYTIKAKVEELQAAKVVPPVTFMKKLKEYQQLVIDYNELLKDFNAKKAELKRLKDELDVMQNGIFAAKIINRSNWLELNEIKFILVDPPKEVVYPTRQNEMARVISLVKVGDEIEPKFEIKKSNDLNLLPKEKD
ncbi:flagellar assembly protein A [Campylobacter gastrosuis]|uniref:FapA family protein n=1 Tax=Campylobacter gastrosuis TaxID=2974576 RepID=A0ABT7HNU1_9BACT|nr:flagellar assembly protein A [Campylobacter gastrosuis]MDL0088310.1 FapA family protein [Campylobacter gastrosuis]